MRSSVQPSQILHAIRRNLVACLVILLVCILTGLGVALATKPVAVATTTLGIQPKSKETPSFSTQAKDLMPTLVELSTSPKVLDPAAANLNMETTDLAEALTVTNPPETLVLSITAKAGSKQEAVDMAQATADSLNKELSSGELLGQQAAEAGMDPKDYVVEQLRSGELRFACEDPDAPENFPRILCSWRTNLLGSSAKGTEFFLRHMVGADNDVNAVENPPEQRPASVTWRDEAPVGKLDLMWTADFRNTSTTLHSDVVLPAATWYEKYDLSTTDMHPFIHSFNAAIDPPWEARSDFDIYRRLAAMVSAWAPQYPGAQTAGTAAAQTPRRNPAEVTADAAAEGDNRIVPCNVKVCETAVQPGKSRKIFSFFSRRQDNKMRRRTGISENA